MLIILIVIYFCIILFVYFLILKCLIFVYPEYILNHKVLLKRVRIHYIDVFVI